MTVHNNFQTVFHPDFRFLISLSDTFDKKRRDKGSKTMFYSNENHALSLNIMYGWWLTYPSEKYESQLG